MALDVPRKSLLRSLEVYSHVELRSHAILHELPDVREATDFHEAHCHHDDQGEYHDDRLERVGVDDRLDATLRG